MTAHMLIVFGILAGAVVLFASGRIRPDVVAILVVLALNLSGVLTIQEAVAGFGQPVVILIAAVSIVGEGLIATGVAYRLGEAVMKAGGSNEARLVTLVMILAGTIGAFMSSSAIVAMFIPVVLTIANKVGLNPKRMLMPLSIATLISGMMTLIASSSNMIVEDTLRARGLAPLGFFSWTPFGVAMLAAAIGFMLVFGRNMLSRETSAGEAGARQPSAYDLLGSYGLADKWHRLQVPHSSPLIGRSAAQLQVPEHFGAVLVGFEKHQHGRAQFLPATPATTFEPDDAIFAVGNEEQAQQLIAAHDLVVLPRLDQRQRHEALQEVGIAEIMLAPEAKLIGRTLRDVGFSSQYDLNVLAIRHRGEKLTTQLEDQTLDFGDTLLVAGGWGEIRRLRDDPEDFVVLTLPAEYSELMPARHRAPIAVAILVAMVAVMASQLVANAAATLIAALAMISTRCVRLDFDLSYRQLEDSRSGRRYLAACNGIVENRRNRVDGAWTGQPFRVGWPFGDAGRRVPGHSANRAVHLQLSHCGAGSADRYRCRESAACLALRVCNNGFDRLLRRVCDTGIVGGEYAGHGAGRLHLRRLCQSRLAAFGADAAGHRWAGRDHLPVLTGS